MKLTRWGLVGLCFLGIGCCSLLSIAGGLLGPLALAGSVVALCVGNLPRGTELLFGGLMWIAFAAFFMFLAVQCQLAFDRARHFLLVSS